ncbi:MAG TPA: hypothetical protein VFO16_24320 [Pseudonocardiaceae bacterium]|nr:hypothetical protein [Pseudonocardiaceae bacterium]
MRKRSLLLAAGACLATLSLTVSTALADPTGPPTFRSLAGVGAGVTNAVMNALANNITDGAGTKIVGSYDSEGSETIQTKATGCVIDRPDGDIPGVDALVAHTADGCVQFARSGLDDHQARPGQNLTYIPFANDAFGYVTLASTTVPSSLTIVQLAAAYNCTNPSVQPLLPHFGEGTRGDFLAKLGLTDAINFTTTHPCVKDTAPDGSPIEENNGTFVTATNQIMPYTTALWISQVTGTVPDLHSATVLRRIGGVTPMQVNPDSALLRPVFNVVPTGQIGAGTLTNQVFVGPTSKVCADVTTIKRFGLSPHLTCGSTAIRTP